MVGLDAVSGAAIIGGILKAIASALGKVARDQVHSGSTNPVWTIIAGLL
jgi:hypothetical protein